MPFPAIIGVATRLATTSAFSQLRLVDGKAHKAVRVSVSLDKQSKRIMRRYAKELPEHQIMAGMNRVVTRELKRLRANAVKNASASSLFKQKFFRKWSGVDKVRNAMGGIWFIARNIRLDRAGKLSGRGGVVKASGGILKRTFTTQDGTILIGKNALRRDGSSRRLRPYWLPAQNDIKRSFRRTVASAPRELDEALHKEMQYRVDKWRKKVTR